MRPGVPAEVDEAGDEEEDGPADPGGAEPVVFLALVEDDLEAAGPDDEGAEAEVVEGWDLGVLDVGRVVDEAVDHEQGEDADGDVDVEGVAPGVGVGEPAAEGGAEDGGDDDSEGEDGHGGAAFGRREGFEQDGLRERLEGSAAGALNDAGEEHEGEGGGGSAGEAGDGEDGDAGHEEALAAEFEGEPVAGGEDDGVGDEVAGEDPGGFVGGGGERAGDVGQRDGGDGGVEHLHEGGEHDGGGDQPGVDAAGDLGRLIGRCCGSRQPCWLESAPYFDDAETELYGYRGARGARGCIGGVGKVCRQGPWEPEAHFISGDRRLPRRVGHGRFWG